MFQPYSVIKISIADYILDMMDCIVQGQNQRGGLYLGNIESAGNGNLLGVYKIGAILTTMSSQEYIYDGNISSMFIRVDDADFVNLSQYFQQAIDFIDQNRLFTNVLVHCYAGISRSATIVIAYLMKSYKMTLDEAFKYVQQLRPIINPNPGFMKQLQQYEAHLFGFNILRSSSIHQNEIMKIQSNQMQIANPEFQIYNIDFNQNLGNSQLLQQTNLFNSSNQKENQDNKLNSQYPIGSPRGFQQMGVSWTPALPQKEFNGQYPNLRSVEFIQN
ncbi:unnamed protein product (macronuclear) [Paramecium tetraurelia]|uniref:protein-tyrosine-phosphatase n=1 Tax=Paramecium tetraurelia TaxID=5888 RepID=A0CV08_PARTE|nr:uncharacterized protein GSPATT00010793001 [Paramecium tetraurelia]CAK74625.1 unnamed protein product [Paramecium tetraurelia]|eukprot:XP_001442022.1 hypothetical protein (macronuclear) [Paramecium tetraurelia strain d4-2]